MQQTISYILIIFIANKAGCGDVQESGQGPVFIYEPPYRVEFLNTTGSVIDCSAHSTPDPVVQWIKYDGSPVQEVRGLRHTPRNGSLVFPPFNSNNYRQDVHTTTYRCTATNAFGRILSRPVQVVAAVKQTYQGNVYDDYVIKGNTAVFKCQIPSFIRDYVRVTAWLRGDNFVIRTGPSTGSRYSSFENGNFHVRNVMANDNNVAYWCQTTHKISGETAMSLTSGKLIVQEPRSIVQPRITHIEQRIRIKEGETAEIPCAAQGHPVPRYRWIKKSGKKSKSVVASDRILQLSGSLIIKWTKTEDSGQYICNVSNSVGSQIAKTELIVSAPYAVYVLPQQQKVDVNQAAMLNCTVTGKPVGRVTWLKDGSALKASENIEFLSDLVLRIKSVRRQDGGMYQCLGENGDEAAQGTSQIYLGDVSPILTRSFNSETLQPGPAISLSCIGTGNPLPSFRWQLDGKLIDNDRRFKISQYVSSDRQVVTHLNVSNIKTEEGGEYSCVAVNKAGKDIYTNKINVYGLPFVREMDNETVVAGMDLVIRCYGGGYPLSEIIWRRDDGNVALLPRHRLFENGTLLIRQSKPRIDDGIYTCIVKNRKGQSARKSIWVKVLVKPKIAPVRVPPKIAVGSRITLMCSIMTGDLPITKEWLKDGSAIPHQLGVTVTELGHTSLLDINNIHSYHNGDYTCVATNQAGSHNATANVLVQVAPTWLQLPRDKTVSLLSQVVLHCSAQGHPPPEITWIKLSGFGKTRIESGDKYHLFQNGSLKIKEVELADESRYKCDAKNGIEPDLTATLQLNVGAMPTVMVMRPMVYVKTGQVTIVKCSAKGDPPLKMSWYRPNGDRMKNESRYEIRTKETNDRFSGKRTVSELLIKSTQREDSSTYICKARNNYGERRKNVSVYVTDRPDPPSNVKVVEYFNRSLTLKWNEPRYVGNSPVTSYVVQHKSRSTKWSEANNISIRAPTTTTKLLGIKIGVRYDLRVLGANAIGESDPGQQIKFIATENGTLILESTVNDANNALFDGSLIWLIIPIVLSIIIVAVIVIFILIYFHRRSSIVGSPVLPDKSAMTKLDGDVKQSLVDELVKTERYGRLEANMAPGLLSEEDYAIKRGGGDYSQYAPSTSSAIYTEVEISPYATFHLPECKNMEDGNMKNRNVEMKTFSRRYDKPKLDDTYNCSSSVTT